MKTDKFIELLNLYLDGELKPSEAAELEREITANPESRRIYRQYCRMQRACTVLADRFRDEAVPVREEEVARSSGGFGLGWLRPVFVVAGGAVAACLVFLAVGRNFTGGKIAPQPVAAVVVPASSVPVVASNPVEPMRAMPVSLNRGALLHNPWGNSEFVSDSIAKFPQNSGVPTSLFDAAPPLPTVRTAPNSLLIELQPGGVNSLRVFQGTNPTPEEEAPVSAFQFQR